MILALLKTHERINLDWTHTMASQEKNSSKKILFFILGGLVLMVGISLILKYWQDVVILFKGAVGMVLALTGLVILSMARE